MNVGVAWSQIFGSREFEEALAIQERHNGLDSSLAKRPATNHVSPTVVLQAGGDDLSGTGSEAIDQHGHRHASTCSALRRSTHIEQLHTSDSFLLTARRGSAPRRNNDSFV